MAEKQNPDYVIPMNQRKSPSETYRYLEDRSLQNPANPYHATLAGLGTGAMLAATPLQFIVAPASSIVGGLIGSVGGYYLGNKASDYLYDNPDKTLYTFAGSPITPRTLTSMGGSMAGSYAIGHLASGIWNNAFPYGYNTTPRTVYGPQGPIVLEPGKTVTVKTPSQTGSVYKTQFGVKHGAKVPSGHSNHKVRSGNGGPYKGKSTSWGSKPHLETSSNIQYTTSTYSNPMVPYMPTQGVIIPLYSPNQPTVVQPPVVTPTPDNRYIEKSEYNSPWEEWYSIQPPGTSYYPGPKDGNHNPGWYIIDRSGGNYKHVKYRVADEPSEGSVLAPVIPDSTRTMLIPTSYPYSSQYYYLEKVPGRVDPNAERSTTEFIDVSKIQ